MQHALFFGSIFICVQQGKEYEGREGGASTGTGTVPVSVAGSEHIPCNFHFTTVSKLSLFQLCAQRQRPTMGTKSKRAQREMQKIYWQTIYLEHESKMWQIICPKLRQVAPGYQSNSQYLRTPSPGRAIDLLSWPGVCCELS